MIRKISLIFALVILIPIQGYAVSETAPPVPSQYADYMPENTESFAEDLWSIIKSAVSVIKPSLTEAGNICAALIAITLLISVVQHFSGTSGNISE